MAITSRNEIIPVLGEIFRECGYSGTSIAVITARTGLGKGSLYNYFPKGKIEMAEAVINEIDRWFEDNIYMPLRESEEPITAINSMFNEVSRYFESGNRICLVGAFALDNTRDNFSDKVSAYFKAWIKALTVALKRSGFVQNKAKTMAEDVVSGIQGALVLARSQNDSKIFTRTLMRLQSRIINYTNN